MSWGFAGTTRQAGPLGWGLRWCHTLSLESCAQFYLVTTSVLGEPGIQQVTTACPTPTSAQAGFLS